MVLRHPTRSVSRYVWIYGIGMLAFTSLTAILALFLKAEHGVTEKTIGFFFTYTGLAQHRHAGGRCWGRSWTALGRRAQCGSVPCF